MIRTLAGLLVGILGLGCGSAEESAAPTEEGQGLSITSNESDSVLAKPDATCSGYGCDGQNPYGAGCFTGSRVVDDKELPVVHSHVRLHYSPACRTVWASIYNAARSPGATAALADIHRNSDKHRYTCDVPDKQSSCYTKMLYDGGTTSHAYGEQDTSPALHFAYTIDY